MARVTYGDLVTEFAGSIGGVTFLRNASGPIAKLRTNPIVNPSLDQSVYQTNLAKLVAYWPTLSQANKDLWDALALDYDHTTPWGDIKTLSGYQWFLSTNLKRAIWGHNPRLSPAVWYAPPPPNKFTIEVSSTYIRAVWSPAYDPLHDLMAYCTLPLRQSSIKLRRSLFHIKNYPAPPSLSNLDLTSEIETLLNVTWATFFASADCNIIIRLIHGHQTWAYWSSFTSAIVKIG